MSFNALSLAKLGIGFGALAVASIGLLSPTPAEGGIGNGGIGHGGKKYELTQSEKQRLRDRAQTLFELRELETIPNEVTVEVSEIDKTVTLESKEIQTSTVNDVQVIADIYQLDKSAILALLIALEDD